MLYHLECIECHKKYKLQKLSIPVTCGGLLDVVMITQRYISQKKNLKGLFCLEIPRPDTCGERAGIPE